MAKVRSIMTSFLEIFRALNTLLDLSLVAVSQARHIPSSSNRAKLGERNLSHPRVSIIFGPILAPWRDFVLYFSG